MKFNDRLRKLGRNDKYDFDDCLLGTESCRIHYQATYGREWRKAWNAHLNRWSVLGTNHRYQLMPWYLKLRQRLIPQQKLIQRWLLNKSPWKKRFTLVAHYELYDKHVSTIHKFTYKLENWIKMVVWNWKAVRCRTCKDFTTLYECRVIGHRLCIKHKHGGDCK